MREPFASEKRCISNLFQMKWKNHDYRVPNVVSEFIAQPAEAKTKPWFNCDFILDFVDPRAVKAKRSASVCSVLPNALGAELFLVVEEDSLFPTALELNGGRAFSLTHYVQYVDLVEEAIKNAVEQQNGPAAQHPHWSLVERASIHNAAFARVLVVGNDVTFLYFPNDSVPTVQGRCINIAEGDDREIYYYLDGDDVVCFDGWIRTDVPESDRVLVAMPEQGA